MEANTPPLSMSATRIEGALYSPETKLLAKSFSARLISAGDSPFRDHNVEVRQKALERVPDHSGCICCQIPAVLFIRHGSKRKPILYYLRSAVTLRFQQEWVHFLQRICSGCLCLNPLGTGYLITTLN